MERWWAPKVLWTLCSIKCANFLITCATVCLLRQILLQGKMKHESFIMFILMFDILVIKKKWLQLFFHTSELIEQSVNNVYTVDNMENMYVLCHKYYPTQLKS